MRVEFELDGEVPTPPGEVEIVERRGCDAAPIDPRSPVGHNLKLQLEGSEEPPLEVAEAASAKQTTATFTLAPGTYHLYCSLFKHDAKGMHATLVVAGG